jgi:uncharacterized protein YjaG (DUF416 family)
MMNLQQYQDQIKAACEPLDHRERVAMCLMCCHRLAPLYLQFSTAENWGGPETLRQVRELAGNWLVGDTSIPAALRSKIDAVIPDTEDFDSVFVSHALNAGTAHADLLDLLLDDKLELVLQVLQDCYDSVDFYVQEHLDSECKGGVTEQQIMSHAAMRAEVSWQFGAIQAVKGNADLINLAHRSEHEPIIEIA